MDKPIGFEEYGTTSGVGAGAERSIYADRQGSVIHVADTVTGTVVASYEYDSYGQLTQTQGTLSQPYAYTGREYDPESGLYHYRARAYDPTVGLFLQVDPIEFKSRQSNFYQYVHSDPINWKDPLGQNASKEMFLLTKANRITTSQNAGAVGSIIGGLLDVVSFVMRNHTKFKFKELPSEIQAYHPTAGTNINPEVCKHAKQQVRKWKRIASSRGACRAHSKKSRNIWREVAWGKLASARDLRDSTCDMQADFLSGNLNGRTPFGEFYQAFDARRNQFNCIGIIATQR